MMYEHLNYFTINHRTLAILIVYVMSIPQGNTANIGCSDLDVCKSCASNEKCSWSLKQQTCHDTIETNRNNTTDKSNLFLSNSYDCPYLERNNELYYAVKNFHRFYNYEIKINNSYVLEYFQKTKCLIQKDTRNLLYLSPNTFNNSIKFRINTFSLNTGVYHMNFLINNTYYIKFNNDVDYFLPIYDSPPTREDKRCNPCVFKDNVYRYYLGCRLSNHPNQQFYDRQLLAYNAANNIKNNYITEINCPDVKIESIEPQTGPSAGGTKINITIKDIEKYLSIKNISKVNVGEYECTSIQPIGNNIITCITSQIRDGYVGSYKSWVIIHYNNNLVFNSSKIIYEYERSEVTNITLHRQCTFESNSTLLKISGKYLNVGKTVIVTIGGEQQTTCDTTENFISCHISCSTNGIVNVKIDDFVMTDDTYFSFEKTCFEKPTVKPNQTFESIVSGGTSLTIHGSNFSLENEMYFIVVDHLSVEHNATCLYQNDTVTVCESTDLLHSVLTDESGTKLNFTIRVKLCDEFLDLDTDSSNFTLRADPIITSFEIENDSILVINGVDLDRGFDTEDVVVMNINSIVLRNSIISRTRNFIKCKLTASSQLLAIDKIHKIIVKIGNALIIVNKRNADAPLSTEITFSGISILTIILVVCMSFSLLGFVLYCIVNKHSCVKQRNINNSEVHLKDIIDQPNEEPTLDTTKTENI